MAAYCRVYDSCHLQVDRQTRTGISSGILRSAVRYGLPLPFFAHPIDGAGGILFWGQVSLSVYTCRRFLLTVN